MITQHPEFTRNTHYQYSWWSLLCMVTITTIRVKLDVPCPNLVFKHRGKELARIEGGWLIIHPAYAWNGCSPKWKVLWFVFGNPDPEATRLASLVHDLFYQFLLCPGFPFTRKDCDSAFFDLLDKWWLRGAYHGAVSKMGHRFAKYDPECTIEFILV